MSAVTNVRIRKRESVKDKVDTRDPYLYLKLILKTTSKFKFGSFSVSKVKGEYLYRKVREVENPDRLQKRSEPSDPRLDLSRDFIVVRIPASGNKLMVYHCPTVTWSTAQAAITEAEHLARQHGAKFGVFKRVKNG